MCASYNATQQTSCIQLFQQPLMSDSPFPTVRLQILSLQSNNSSVIYVIYDFLFVCLFVYFVLCLSHFIDFFFVPLLIILYSTKKLVRNTSIRLISWF